MIRRRVLVLGMLAQVACVHSADVPPARGDSVSIVSAVTLTTPATRESAAVASSTAPSPTLPSTWQLQSGTTTAVRGDSTGHPVTPIIYASDCLGEDCMIKFGAHSCSAVALHAEHSDSSPVVGHTRAGKSVLVTARDLYVTRPGIIEVKRALRFGGPEMDSLFVVAGDTLYEIHPPTMESGPMLWHRGRSVYIDRFWATFGELPGYGTTVRGDTTVAVERIRPDWEDWWYVKSDSGHAGWWSNDRAGMLSDYDMSYWEDKCPPPK